MSIISIKQSDEFGLNIKWRLTDACNYRCSYCIRKDKVTSRLSAHEDSIKVFNTLPDVAKLISNRNVSTRIELIGGEVSLLDLEEFLSQLFYKTGSFIKRVNITSNLSESIDYYNRLIRVCVKHNCELSIMFSWHREFVRLSDFMRKFLLLDRHPLVLYKLETVSTSDNEAAVQEFITVCDGLKVEYSVDPDVKDKNYDTLIIKANRDAQHQRYHIIKDDGDDVCNSLRELLLKYGDYNRSFIDLKGYYCSLDYNYVYIDKDMHIGFNEQRQRCKVPEPFRDFKLRDSIITCPKGCSLCGYMSVSKNKQDIE